MCEPQVFISKCFVVNCTVIFFFPFLPVITCPLLRFPEFGHIEYTIQDHLNNFYLEGDRAIYGCNIGHIHVFRTCLSNGSWSDNASDCIGMYTI